MKRAIEEMANGNSKKLVTYFIIMVFAMVLNFAQGTISTIASMTATSPKDVKVAVEKQEEKLDRWIVRSDHYNEKEYEVLNKQLIILQTLVEKADYIIKQAEKMEKFRERNGG